LGKITSLNTWRLVLLLAAFLLPANVQAQQPVQWRNPPMRLPPELRDSLRFGYLNVPRDHSQPNGPQFRIAIAVVKARTATPQPDPVVFIPGGPGLSGLDTYLRGRVQGEHPFDAFRANRDLIIIDPRGFGYSEPRMCPHVEEGDPLTPESPGEAEWLTALAECGAGMKQHGIDLATLSSAQAARDLDLVRKTVGAQQVNLFGASYGTRIALEATQNIPAAVRAAYLFGPVAAHRFRGSDDSTVVNEASEAMLRVCAAQPACSTAYPQLRADYDAAMTRVQREPFRVGDDFVIDANVLAQGLVHMLASRRLGAGVPLLVHTIAREGTAVFKDLAPHLEAAYRAGRGVPGTGQAFWCNDGVINQASNAAMQQRCKNLMGRVAPQFADSALTGDVPVLMSVGELDPLTPPSFAQSIAQRFPNARVITLPAWGHELAPPCSFVIATQFFDAPAQPLDTTCLAAMEKMEFVTGVDAGKWLRGVDKQPTNWLRLTQRLGLAFAGFVFVVSTTLLILRSRRRAREAK
jgi:pimeloyl-ACP methyl ester carboxylesterase